MKKIISIFILILSACTCMAQYHVESSNGEIRVDLQSNKGRKGASKFLVPTKMMMKVSCEDKQVVSNEIGLTVKSEGRRYAFGKSDIIRANKGENMVEHPDMQDTLLADFSGRYNTLLLATDKGMLLEVRVYNDGVAYRFRVSGYPTDYKILEVCDVFPDEKPIAILGTFEGDYLFPWRTMKVQVADNGDRRKKKITTITKSPAQKGGARVVSWRDALSSVSVGVSVSMDNGDTWGDIGDIHHFRADFTYKYIYGGISVSSCSEIQYIPWGDDFWPFDGVIAGIDSWGLGIRGGFCLPVQNGYEVWSFIPYVATSMMHLHQHGKVRPDFKPLDMHNHWLVGPGVKVQLALRKDVMLGAGYEYQFFTDKKAPKGMHTFSVSIGKMF